MNLRIMRTIWLFMFSRYLYIASFTCYSTDHRVVTWPRTSSDVCTLCIVHRRRVVDDDLMYANGQQFVPHFSLERSGLRNRFHGYP